MINMIAAIGKNNELGYKNKLIWNLPNDLKIFKETTMGKPIVMGYNTFLSLPKILPGRKHIVLSFNKVELPSEVELFTNIEDVLEYIKQYDEVFIIGGASIYKAFISYVDKLYLTEIDATSTADAYFPNFDKSMYNKKILANNEDNGIKYEHVLYERK